MMIYLKTGQDGELLYACASEQEGLVAYEGALPEFPINDQGDTDGWRGYRLVGDEIVFDQTLYDDWRPTPPPLSAEALRAIALEEIALDHDFRILLLETGMGDVVWGGETV